MLMMLFSSVRLPMMPVSALIARQPCEPAQRKAAARQGPTDADDAGRAWVSSQSTLPLMLMMLAAVGQTGKTCHS